MMKRVPAFMMMALVCAAVPLWAAGPNANPYFAAVGKVDRIDYRYEDFDLIGDHGTFRIVADHSNVILPGGKLGAIRDLKNGQYVRIQGEQLSADSARANIVTVLDETGKFSPRGTSYRPDERIEVRGAVVRVYAAQNEIDLRCADRDCVVVVRRETVIKRYLYPADIGDIREGHQIAATGTLTGGKVYADRIQISKGSLASPAYYRDREDVVEGKITFAPSQFDRSFALQTPHGERKVDVRRDAVVTRNGRDISMHDLAKGDLVRAYGNWDGSTLDCGRVEVIDERTALPPPPAVEDSTLPAPEPPANPPAEQNPPEVQPDEPPAEQPAQPSNVRTGRIIAIDHAKFTMTIDSNMTDITIDAANATVTRRESSRRFSDLKQGDKVTVTGSFDVAQDGVVKATAIEIVD